MIFSGRHRLLLSAAFVALLATFGFAQQPVEDLTTMTLEELINIDISSVSKKDEKLFRTAAAAYVITQEDIRRSSATSIPELLRMAPGLEVARINANIWAITARGFNGRFADKLLVMIDGRSVYTPLSSGVNWDLQDLVLEDIERIEVIRGPGATLWGANAVNGVINIITKSAKDTQGGLLTIGGGSEEHEFGSFRYGGQLGGNTHYRVYAKYFNRANTLDASGKNAADHWDMLHGGFRLDSQASARDSLTLQGDIFQGDIGQTSSLTLLTPPFRRIVSGHRPASGGNLMGRWARILSDRSDMAVRLYFDRTNRDEIRFAESRNIFDFDFQHHAAVGRLHDLIWGFGYRVMSDEINGTFTRSADPEERTDHLYSAYVQDELKLIRDVFHLTLGTKVEHNSYTGLEIQPNVRLLWTPDRRQSLWAAVARAARTPARNDAGIRVNTAAFPGQGGRTTLIRVLGNPDLKSEYLVAYELGYRVQPGRRFSFDVAAFYNTYNNLELDEPEDPFIESVPAPPHLVIPERFGNLMSGKTYGVEVAANWNVTRQWQLRAGYSSLHIQLRPDPKSNAEDPESEEGNSPKHQVQLRSHLRLPRNFEFDASFNFVSRLANQQIPSYARLDARVGWRMTEQLDASIGLLNLLSSGHREYGVTEDRVTATEIKRSIYGKVTWRF